jgi:predicted RND superfamily exporter protein
MAVKKEKKVDPKAVAKEKVMEVISKALAEAGYEVLSGADFGMTAGTVVVRDKEFDVQVKPIVPKTGVSRYVAGE